MEKNKTKNKKYLLTEKVLNVLAEKSLEFLDLSVKIMFDPKQLARDCGLLYKSPTALRNLQRSPYFKYQDKKFYVTGKGRMKIIRNIIQNKKNKNKKGQWNGIIFDIPEANRRERAFIRRELTMAGCKELQKSVWITPLNIEKELLVLLTLWKKDFKGDIRFLRISKISGEKEVKNYFKDVH